MGPNQRFHKAATSWWKLMRPTHNTSQFRQSMSKFGLDIQSHNQLVVSFTNFSKMPSDHSTFHHYLELFWYCASLCHHLWVQIEKTRHKTQLFLHTAPVSLTRCSWDCINPLMHFRMHFNKKKMLTLKSYFI